ncbi:hypothetical protein HMPREF2111_00413 [Staphylococcus aureus 917]|nr:putative membrane protein [Staphylococcus aureus subsp. aureus CIGC345D]KIE16358.1 hypothetical protein HMPREF2111_00413 [Staphylococcus aureus 917]
MLSPFNAVLAALTCDAALFTSLTVNVAFGVPLMIFSVSHF